MAGLTGSGTTPLFMAALTSGMEGLHRYRCLANLRFLVACTTGHLFRIGLHLVVTGNALDFVLFNMLGMIEGHITHHFGFNYDLLWHCLFSTQTATIDTEAQQCRGEQKENATK